MRFRLDYWKGEAIHKGDLPVHSVQTARSENRLKKPCGWALGLAALLLVSLACRTITGPFEDTTPTPAPSATLPATPLPPAPVQPGGGNPDEPIHITGLIPFTSPFFLSSTAEPFVLLEDQAGFIRRDRDFAFPPAGQVLGPVEFLDDQTLRYSLTLPAVPLGTPVDVDQDGEQDAGVQVFAVAYWSNTWADPFIEPRDGTGWSNAYSSTITDPDREDEIVAGTLIVWAPDGRQEFPTGFGPDQALFTADDPVSPVPAGYSLVDLNQDPFRIYKQAQPVIDLEEGVVAVNDFSDRDYGAAFDAMFAKARREYPFQDQKNIPWDDLQERFGPRAADARDTLEFYRAIRDFTFAIPDGHVGVSFNRDAFLEDVGGSLGLLLAELGDGRVIATRVLPGTPADRAGIRAGAEMITWNDQPISSAIAQVEPFFGPYSTAHHLRTQQVLFLPHMPQGTRVELEYRNPGGVSTQTARMRAELEVESLFIGIPAFNLDPLALPVEARVLEGSGLGYIAVTSFSEDTNLTARLWDAHMQALNENQVPGLIIDLRTNGGGSSGLALDFAGYFFDEAFPLFERAYYSESTGQFERRGQPSRVEPAGELYEGPLAVLIGPDCASACEGFAYALSQGGRATLVGHYPTGGLFGEVGRGQYSLPDDISVQFPTGRPVALDGSIPIEGTGVPPDILVPVTEDSALGRVDAVLEAAVQAIRDQLES